MNMLEVQDLVRTFGGVRAAWHVDLSLAAGELRCLIGPNGAGKSTLFKLIMGLIPPQQGAIRFDGQDLTRLQPFRRVRRGVSMKYQTTRVYQAFTVAQNVAIARSSVRRNGDLMDWALGYFELHRDPARPVSQLTHAEQHWLEMCLTLGNAPKLVLMDEPNAGMTPDETHRTADFIKQLNGRGVAVVVIGHDMGFVREIGSIVTVMHEGSVLRQGSFEEIEQDAEVQRVYLGEHHE